MEADNERFRSYPTREVVLSGIALGILAVVYLLHFSAMCIHAVDLPEKDEFLVFLESTTYLEERPDWNWLFRRHNEHMFVLTRLQGWFLYRLNGWDLVSQQVMNFILWGLLLALTIWVARRLQPRVPLWSVAGFVIFLLSPLGYWNHAWGIQSQFHFSLLFFLLAAWALFSEAQRNTALGLGVVWAWLAIYAQAGGAVATLVLFGCYLLFKGLRVYAASPGPERRREIRQGLAILVVLGAGLALWLKGLRLSPGGQAMHAPWMWSFWRSFANAVSYGFGYTRISTFWGMVCLLLVLTPIIGQFVRSRGRPTPSFWAVSTLLLGVLAILASTALGRGALKGPRYFQYAVFLLPFCFLAWRAFLAQRTRLRPWALLALWLVCAFGFKDHLSLDVYQRKADERRANEARVRDYYHGVGPLPTTLMDPRLERPIATYLENARLLGVSFARRLAPPPTVSLVPAAKPGNDLPIGFLNIIENEGVAVGWALDPDTPSEPVDVHFYLDGPSGGEGAYIGRVRAESPRFDVNRATGYPGDHGFRFTMPEATRDGRRHTLYVYGIDPAGGPNPQLSGSGMAFRLGKGVDAESR